MFNYLPGYQIGVVPVDGARLVECLPSVHKAMRWIYSGFLSCKVSLGQPSDPISKGGGKVNTHHFQNVRNF